MQISTSEYLRFSPLASSESLTDKTETIWGLPGAQASYAPYK